VSALKFYASQTTSNFYYDLVGSENFYTIIDNCFYSKKPDILIKLAIWHLEKEGSKIIQTVKKNLK